MSDHSTDPGIGEEPHLRGGSFEADPSEAQAKENLRVGKFDRDPIEQRVEHGVWDEPSLSSELAGDKPKGAATFRSWIERGRARTGFFRSWTVTALVAAVAGPFAILGAFMGQNAAGGSAIGILVLVVFAPVIEETMKIAAAAYVVEKRPWLFTSSTQIIICCLAGGFIFAAIENLLYLHVYVPDPPEWLPRWRWTVCVALHMGCSLIAGMGLVRIWRGVWGNMSRAKLSLGYPYVLVAVIIHGTYNGFAFLLNAASWF